MMNILYVQAMKVAKCPTDELSLTNCAVVSEQDFDVSRIRFALLFISELCVRSGHGEI